MSDEAGIWLSYAEENREVAALSLGSHLFNACIQNAQQATEKALKAIRFARGLPLKKTHSIRELRDDAARIGVEVPLSDDDCDLLDSVYLPSKYPLGSALPHFEPDERLAQQCLDIADAALAAAMKLLDPCDPAES